MDSFLKLLDPELIKYLADAAKTVPVLVFVLAVMLIFYLVIRGLLKIIDKKLNGDK